MLARENIPKSQSQGCEVYAEKNASAVNSEPAIVYAHSSAFLMGTRSAITPMTGLDRATIAVETATPRLHIELPVKLIPKKEALLPSDSSNRNTK